MITMQKMKLKTLIEVFGKDKSKKWIKKYPILKNKDVERWIIDKAEKFSSEGKEIEKFNVLSYLRPLSTYCEYWEVENPEELLKEDIDSRNKRVLDYLNHLVKEGKNEVSVRNAYQSRIKSFYSARGSPVSAGLKTRDSGKNAGVTALDKDTIKKIYERLTNKNYRVILKSQALLGLRISDVLTEMNKNVKGKPKYVFEKHKDHYFIRNFETQKEKIRIDYLFFPRELTKLIQSIYKVKDLTNLKLNTFLKTRNDRNIDRYEYSRIIKDIGKELKLGNIRTHSFRKYFRTQLGKVNLIEKDNRISGNIENQIIESLMGHKVDYSIGVYAQNLKDLDLFYEIWLHFEKVVSIDIDIVDNTSKDVKKLQVDKQILQSELVKQEARLEVIERENKELKETISDLEVNLKREIMEKMNFEMEKKLAQFYANLDAYEKNPVEYKKRHEAIRKKQKEENPELFEINEKITQLGKESSKLSSLKIKGKISEEEYNIKNQAIIEQVTLLSEKRKNL